MRRIHAAIARRTCTETGDATEVSYFCVASHQAALRMPSVISARLSGSPTGGTWMKSTVAPALPPCSRRGRARCASHSEA